MSETTNKRKALNTKPSFKEEAINDVIPKKEKTIEDISYQLTKSEEVKPEKCDRRGTISKEGEELTEIKKMDLSWDSMTKNSNNARTTKKQGLRRHVLAHLIVEHKSILALTLKK